MTDPTLTSCVRLRDWFIQDVLPLWSARGYDHQRGGFYEALDLSGAPLTDQPRRVRVQARQIYTFTQSTRKGWCDQEALASKAFEFFIDKACPDMGARGCVHLLSDDGDVLDNRRDLYDQAFLLLACAARIKVGDIRALPLAENTIDFINGELASPHGGWQENDANSLPRRQNPHMHLFEAFMALYEATDDQQYLGIADSLYTLFLNRFYDAKTGALLEYFDTDLAPLSSPESQFIEPGHMMEWVWLLDHYRRHHRSSNDSVMAALFSRAVELGADHQGFLVDRVLLSENNTRASRRAWPQTEYIKASLIMALNDTKDAQANNASQLIDKVFETYLNQPVAGLWCDQYDGAGEPAVADAPASILYHWFEAAAQASAYVNNKRIV